jgi:hypothetical protein
VAGVKVDEWVANQNLGSNDPVAQTRTSRTVSGVSIANGAQIKLEAVQNVQEWGRYDNIEITAAAPSPPGGFSLSSPANGATGQSTSPTLSWGASSGATSYTLVVADNSGYTNPVFSQDVGNVTTRQITGLASATVYYWKVTAHNSAGDTAASNSSFSFTTAATPPAGQVLPAESGTLAGGATVSSSANAENGQYVGNMHLSGASDTISGVDGGASGGSYTLTIRYATNDTNPTLDLYVNGTFVGTLTFTKTNGWETFASTSTSITLNAGAGNTIMFKHNATNTGGVNLDTLRVQ